MVYDIPEPVGMSHTMEITLWLNISKMHYLPWVAMAQYLVRRVTIEPNRHTFYLTFIDSLIEWPLKGLVLQEEISILLATTPLNHSAAGSGMKSLGHWLSLPTLVEDRCVSDTELTVREILIKAVHKGPLFCYLWSFLWASCSGAVIKTGFLAHFIHGLWRSWYSWASCMGFQVVVVVFAYN